MPSHFDLIITADYPNRTADLRLLDAHGSQLAYRQTDFKTIAVSRRQGLFDLGDYLRHYVEEGKEAVSIAEIGVCIAEEVLGADIFRMLAASGAQRTLRIQLPGATEEENHLAAALARVPWEMARPAADEPTLGERNLLVRVVHDRDEPWRSNKSNSSFSCGERRIMQRRSGGGSTFVLNARNGMPVPFEGLRLAG
jgi:hypothetical protein